MYVSFRRRCYPHSAGSRILPANHLVHFICRVHLWPNISHALVILILIFSAMPPVLADEVIREIGGKPYPDNTECHPLTPWQSHIEIANLHDTPMIARYCWDGTPGFAGLSGEKTCQQQGLRKSKIIMPNSRITILSDAPQPETSDGVSARLLCFLCPPDQPSDACIESQSDKAELDGAHFRDMGEYETSANEAQRQQQARQPKPPPQRQPSQAGPEKRSCGTVRIWTQFQNREYRDIDDLIHSNGNDSVEATATWWYDTYYRPAIAERLSGACGGGCEYDYHVAQQTYNAIKRCAAGLKSGNYQWSSNAPHY